jgi:hypothetical protein
VKIDYIFLPSKFVLGKTIVSKGSREAFVYSCSLFLKSLVLFSKLSDFSSCN